VNRHTTSDLLAPSRADAARVSEWGREVLEAEGNAILDLKERIGKDFERAVQLLLEVQGQVLTSGVGKSGLVAKKIAATLTSTGTPASFVHPVDAIHGDLGIVTEKDLVQAIADGVNPQQAKAEVIMTADPATVGADEDVGVVAVKMTRLGVRHLPVVNQDGEPVGLLSARDLLAVLDRG